MAKSPNVAIGVIGIGLAGGSVASALRAAGYDLVAVNARSEEAQERAEVMLPGVPNKSAADVAKESDVVILAVPDSQIQKVARDLVSQEALRPGQVVVHLWGGGGLETLAPVLEAGATPIAIHPAMTFTGTSLDVSRLEDCPMAYTAQPLAVPVAQSLIASMGGDPFAVAEEDRPAYHAALVHAANHLVTLVNEGVDILANLGVDEPAEVLGPLVRTALERGLLEGWSGLTGPASRGDWETVKKHLEALQERPELASVAPSYKAMAEATRRAVIKPRSGPIVVHTRAHLKEALATVSGPVGLVMTMGALHEGHLALVEQAKVPGGVVVATIFVNPTQFGEGEDFDTYPRTLKADVKKLDEAGVDIIYAPSEEEVYPTKPRVTINPGPAATVLEGALRPGHFDGVTLVVTKMFDLIRPNLAVFGQKDAQQFSIISQMVRDLDQQVRLVEAPIVRDEDGLALSSRNAYLSKREKQDALGLHKSLEEGAHVARAGGNASQILQATVQVLQASPGVLPLYAALATKENFEVVAVWAAEGVPTLVDGQDLWGGVREGSSNRFAGTAYLLVAAEVGPARLIDNVIVNVT